MQSFCDREGTNWDLDLNIGMAIKLKSRLNFDLENLVSVDIADPNKKTNVSNLEKIASDAILMFNIIYVLCESQCQQRCLTEEDFAQKFDAATVENATEALLDEIVNFSRPAKKKVLQHILRVSREFSLKAGKEMDQILNDPAFQENMEKELEEHLKKLSTNAPGSAE